MKIYNTIDKNKLIKFYGYSEKYGFIYEWLNDFKYLKKVSLELNDGTILTDIDKIIVNSNEKFIDFER